MICPHCGHEIETSDSSRNLSPKDLEQVNAKVDYIIETARNKTVNYGNRDRIPERIRHLCDAYVEACGKDKDGVYLQEPTKGKISFWIMTLDEWLEERIKPEHVFAAWQYVREEAKYLVASPAALTKAVIGMKSKNVVSLSVASDEEVQKTQLFLEDKWKPQQVISSEERERLGKEMKQRLAAKLSVSK